MFVPRAAIGEEALHAVLTRDESGGGEILANAYACAPNQPCSLEAMAAAQAAIHRLEKGLHGLWAAVRIESASIC